MLEAGVPQREARNEHYDLVEEDFKVIYSLIAKH